MALKTSRRAAIDPFIVMEVMRAANERAAEGGDILHMEVGQPSTPAPRKVLEAAKQALDSHLIGYTDALGLPALRQRIAQHYRDFYGADVPASRIAVTTGSSGGFLLSFLAAFDPGDRVALAMPGYPCYRHILTALGLEPVLIETHAATKFQPTIADLDRIEGRLDGLIIASPSNPVGAVLPAAELTAIAEWCATKGVRLVSDEIYHGITFGAPASTAARLEGAIVINSFSKYFSMTGWRLGWMVLPEDLVKPVERLAQNFFISAPALSQLAGIAAFDAHDELQGNVARYGKNREILLNDLPAAGFDNLITTDGAFYIYANVARLTNDSLDFCRRMLSETGVAATPGIDFDPARGRHFMRFCFSGATADMVEAARRLKEWRK
ncbi:pyridoxal phosphate-dependent aminotransferase [Dongia rigui]|uniref:Aminotransferase n=1 Tax=Dongia rigui TaxID=940149 RepID=A0ABU5E134_9PROT|nr:aminotransferase class I/II-fold pyridoxal phosphate-dependent enzyme [Dongia rigui]MDY0873178.1 aminotransferase class I/II-fold pyridoxal phosphate-dependent enzyme [Dongia rigui]